MLQFSVLNNIWNLSFVTLQQFIWTYLFEHTLKNNLFFVFTYAISKYTPCLVLFPGSDAGKKTTISLNVFKEGRTTCLAPVEGAMPIPLKLSMSFNLNQISIFMSGRCKHWVRNQYNLKRFGCILAQMGLCPDTLKLPQIAFRGFLFTLCCASHRACQKKKLCSWLLFFTAYLILWLSPT